MKEQQTRSVLILGGAGFIGSNLAHHLLVETEARVHVFDNLTRAGVHHNLEWLHKAAGKSGRLQVTIGDVRDASLVTRAVSQANEIYHFAAQVAVTTSLLDPRFDFDVNVGGTFNVLDAARRCGHKPFILFTSTNKVYGEMQPAAPVMEPTRYIIPDHQGTSESEPLDFHSPYGCSKGAADQYVRDFSRVYGLPAVVFRMSCIAGNSTSLLELMDLVERFTGHRLEYVTDARRVADQLFYVTDYRKMQRHTGWQPKVSLRETLELLRGFWEENQAAIHPHLAAPVASLAMATELSGRAG